MFPSTTAAHWQSFQMNLPVTPVTDIKVAHKDLVLSTQGRSFWILDNLTPLDQLNDKVTTAQAYLFAPREAHSHHRPRRRIGRGARGFSIRAAGATIDYYLAAAPSGDITIEVLDAAGKPVRKFTSAAAPAEERPADAEAPAERGRRRRLPHAQRRRRASTRAPACIASPGTCAIPGRG